MSVWTYLNGSVNMMGIILPKIKKDELTKLFSIIKPSSYQKNGFVVVGYALNILKPAIKKIEKECLPGGEHPSVEMSLKKNTGCTSCGDPVGEEELAIEKYVRTHYKKGVEVEIERRDRFSLSLNDSVRGMTAAEMEGCMLTFLIRLIVELKIVPEDGIFEWYDSFSGWGAESTYAYAIRIRNDTIDFMQLEKQTNAVLSRVILHQIYNIGNATDKEVQFAYYTNKNEEGFKQWLSKLPLKYQKLFVEPHKSWEDIYYYDD